MKSLFRNCSRTALTRTSSSASTPLAASAVASRIAVTSSVAVSSTSSSSTLLRVASFSSGGASYDPSSYTNMPAEPQYSMPSDTPKGTFELFYFALRGRAEQVRLLLAEAGLPHKDRLLTQWQLRKLKATGSPTSNTDYLTAQKNSPLPFGGLPLLRHDGVLLGQTQSILQYVAELGASGLMPSNPELRAKANMCALGCEDLFQTYWPISIDRNKYHYHSGSFPLTPGTMDNYLETPSTYLKAPFSQYTVPRAFRRDDLPRFLTQFEAILSKNTEGKSEYLVGKERTYADIVLFAHLSAVQDIEPTCLDSFPLLKAHYKRIGERPNIKKYMASRPDSGL